jgi:hypothetical protein
MSKTGTPTRGWAGNALTQRLGQVSRVLTLVVVRIAGAGLAGVLAVYVARAHGAEYSGQFFYLVSTLTITSVLTRLGAEPYLTSQIATSTGGDQGVNDGRSRAEYLVSTFAAVVLLVLLAGVLLTALEVLAPSTADRLLGDLSTPLLVLAVVGLNTTWIVTGYCRARGMAALSIFLETGLLSLWLLGLLILTDSTGEELTSPSVALGVAIMCPTLIAPLTPMLLSARRSLITYRGMRDAIAGVIAFGAVTVTNGIIVLIPLQVLGWNGMDHEAGIYNAALRVSMFVGASGVVVKSIVVRQHVERGGLESSGARDLIRSAAIAIPWVVVSLLIAWQSRPLAALFGPEFMELQSIILVMLLAQSVNVAGFLIETRAVLANDRRLLNITSISTVAVALCSSPILIDRFGLEGAAWAFALTIVVSRSQLALLYVLRSRAGRRETAAEPKGIVDSL